MYSFEARPDCQALDEPLYRQWLQDNVQTAERPYKEYMLSGRGPMSPGSKGSGANWTRELLSWPERVQQAASALPPNSRGILFCKHMAKHAPQYNFEDELQGYQHVHLLLLRDPVAVLSAWGAVADNHGNVATPDEVGIVPLLSIYSTLRSSGGCGNDKGRRLAVLDADELVQNPPVVLQDLCQQLGIPYTDAMLTWEAGPHESDGPWADWWYKSVRKSSGWTVSEDIKYRTLPTELYPALESSLPAYQYLSYYTHGYRNRGPPAEEIYNDPRNEHLLVYIGARGRGRIVPRRQAGVSPWDGSVQGGDATSESLRVERGKILGLGKHLRRLQCSAQSLGFENVHTSKEITKALFQTLAANGMRDGAHMQVTLSRGEKSTGSSMDPKFHVYGTTLIILPEWNTTQGTATAHNPSRGISVVTASVRHNSPSTSDPQTQHSNNKVIHTILSKFQSNLVGRADTIMLDIDEHVSEVNATAIFVVDGNGTLVTPHGDNCWPGIAGADILLLAQELGLPHKIRGVSVAELYAAQEVFTIGTTGELTPATCVDGRTIGTGVCGPITARLQQAFQTLPERPGWATEIPLFED